MKTINPGNQSNDSETLAVRAARAFRSVTKNRSALFVGGGCAALLLAAVIALPVAARVPKAMADPSLSADGTYVPDMMQDEDYTPVDTYSGGVYDTGDSVMPVTYAGAGDLIIDVEQRVPADSLVTIDQETAEADAAAHVPDDKGVDDPAETDDTSVNLQWQNSGYRPSYESPSVSAGETGNRPEYDGELAALRQEIASLRQQLLDQGGQSTQAGNNSNRDEELEALRQEIARLQQQMNSQESAKTQENTQTGGQQTGTSNQGTSDTTPPDWLVPDDTTPPDWLIPSDAARTGGNDGVPGWLYGTFGAALLNNPYDNGPLSRTSYAQVPMPGYGTRVRCELDFECWALTQGDLLNFVKNVVEPTDADWVTIFGSDGKGIQFTGGCVDYADYGPVDEYGRVTDKQYRLTLTEKGYTYERVSSGGTTLSLSSALLPLTYAPRNEMSVDGTDQRYVYVVPGLYLGDLKQGDLRRFADEVVANATCNWVAIACIDGYGIQFYGGNPDVAYCGPMDDMGRVYPADYLMQWNGQFYSVAEIVG